MQYRNELKHLITAGDRAAICATLRVVAKLDPHAQSKGFYTVRSLYFDNIANKALREKTDGANEREKFRIRYYDGDTSLIHLEKKVKRGGLGYKISCDLTAQEVGRIVEGDTVWMATDCRALVTELYAKMKYQGLKPKIIVDYERIPFVYKAGNVRVTVDHNIRTGLRYTDFLNPACVTIPVAGNNIVLEVKWDDYLPNVIRHAVQLKGRSQTAFSKYVICRMYD